MGYNIEFAVIDGSDFKTPERSCWTETTLDCYMINQDCDSCEIKKFFGLSKSQKGELKCYVPEYTKSLLQTKKKIAPYLENSYKNKNSGDVFKMYNLNDLKRKLT